MEGVLSAKRLLIMYYFLEFIEPFGKAKCKSQSFELKGNRKWFVPHVSYYKKWSAAFLANL